MAEIKTCDRCNAVLMGDVPHTWSFCLGIVKGRHAIAHTELATLRTHITELQQRCDDTYTAYVASDKAHEEKIARIAELEKENEKLKAKIKELSPYGGWGGK